VVVLQNEINNVPYIIDRCYEKEMKIFFNAAPYDESIQNYPIEKVTWLVVNETESAALSGEENYEKMLQVLKISTYKYSFYNGKRRKQSFNKQ